MSLSLLATACGSGDTGSKDGSGADAKTAAKPSAPARTGKSAAELAPLLVNQADLPQYKVEADSPKGDPARKVESDKPACKPLVQLQGLVPISTPSGTPSGTVVASVSEKRKPVGEGATLEEQLDALKDTAGVSGTSVVLDSYDAKGAQEAFASLKDASTACAGGYTSVDGAKTTKVQKVLPSAQITAGDESLAFQLVLELAGGAKGSMQFVVVRKGGTLATFEGLSVIGEAAQPPKAVVEAQSKKLG
ncbi:hypothetical protein [Streptomyces sp. NBC_00091]|uniref:hypothetical protein n=1 Tax=Streptomyces sp. NBC_00091 TaxID=2975648 RepID=UPI00225A7EDE|nr:hypothetical protein [Streptomyces sp. NBC_00091]MCX5376470.1 hypothetical protein [Streptomyces sp. NBC_00091]